jgi:serine/threonine protein kinase HipA of HipAB toxin-antitoxin module
LECERFDRVGAEGRRGAVSLFALDTSRYGILDNWTAAANRLADDAVLSSEDAERIRLIDAFGALIANTDRHFGNITLFDRYEGLFELAPFYDMVPMLFAPQGGQIVGSWSRRHLLPRGFRHGRAPTRSPRRTGTGSPAIPD